jgi:beta-phosphoglucomutase-like phosphatase (HAD superfamily)
MRIEPVFLFDLDGTLVGSVYQHVLASWRKADVQRGSPDHRTGAGFIPRFTRFRSIC